MSLQQLRAFLEKAKADKTIESKLLNAKTPDEVVSIAKEHGHEFTADKLNISLSEEELEAMAAGAITNGKFCGATVSLMNCRNTGLEHCSVPTGNFCDG